MAGAKRPRTDGQEMSFSRYGPPPSLDGWSDDGTTVDDRPQKKSRRDPYSSADFNEAGPENQGPETRTWTREHLNAADIKNPEIVGALTPPQHGMPQGPNDLTHISSPSNDVDVRGPMGTTPLMIASYRGGGLDTGDLGEGDDGSDKAQVIQELIAQGAKLSATMEKTQETPLHLAARYARADAAKKLLDAGADANAQVPKSILNFTSAVDLSAFCFAADLDLALLCSRIATVSAFEVAKLETGEKENHKMARLK